MCSLRLSTLCTQLPYCLSPCQVSVGGYGGDTTAEGGSAFPTTGPPPPATGPGPQQVLGFMCRKDR